MGDNYCTFAVKPSRLKSNIKRLLMCYGDYMVRYLAELILGEFVPWKVRLMAGSLLGRLAPWQTCSSNQTLNDC